MDNIDNTTISGEVNYVWAFPLLKIKYQEGELEDVVTGVDWLLTAKDSDGYIANQSGTITLEGPVPEKFIPFSDINEKIVESWATNALGQTYINKVKTSLKTQILNNKNITETNIAPPWNRTEEQS